MGSQQNVKQFSHFCLRSRGRARVLAAHDLAARSPGRVLT